MKGKNNVMERRAYAEKIPTADVEGVGGLGRLGGLAGKGGGAVLTDGAMETWFLREV